MKLTGAIVCLASTAAVASAQQQAPRFTEEINVNRVLVDVRVVDAAGHPMPGLGPGNFKVSIDRRDVRVESATWVADAPSGHSSPASRSNATASSGVLGGRLVVLLFQKDLEPSRIVGVMRMVKEVRQTLDTLGRDDRVAVLSYDSRLRFWLDFTNDFDRVRSVLAHDILFGNDPMTQPSLEQPSLFANIDRGALDHAYPIERALALIGAALEPLPGAKSLVLFGYGLGRLGSSGLQMERNYGSAVAALQRARASVFCLDVTDAGYHSLEGGLELVAQNTGGFYAKTHEFAQLALDRLAGALTGYYTLLVEVAGRLLPGTHDIAVELHHAKGNVMVTNTSIK